MAGGAGGQGAGRWAAGFCRQGLVAWGLGAPALLQSQVLCGRWSPQSLSTCGSPTQRHLLAICPGLCSLLPQDPAWVLPTAHLGICWAASWGRPRLALPLLPVLIPPAGMEPPPPQDSTVWVPAQTPPAQQRGSRAADEWPRAWTRPRTGALTPKGVPSSP